MTLTRTEKKDLITWLFERAIEDHKNKFSYLKIIKNIKGGTK